MRLAAFVVGYAEREGVGADMSHDPTERTVV